MSGSDSRVLVLGPQSGIWRRRLGAQAWSVLEHLALAACHDQQGWTAPVGVRGIAANLGVTKDTAARAVTVLRFAGLVTLEQLDRLDGRRRTGYRLHLPVGIQLRTCPADRDGPLPGARTDHCPASGVKGTCPANQDSAYADEVTESGGRRPRRDRQAAGRPAPTLAQPTLFDSSTSGPAGSTP